jgi:hypothetical protein
MHGSHAGGQAATGGGQAAGGRRSQLQQQQPALLTVKARSATSSVILFIACVSLRESESFGSFTASAARRFGAGKKLARCEKNDPHNRTP